MLVCILIIKLVMKIYNSIIVVVLVFFIAGTSCNKENKQVSDSGNPLTELEWLKNIKQDLEISAKATGAQIIQYTYNQNTVFWIDGCHSCDDNLIEIYNYEGEVICEIGGIAGLNTCPDFLDTATDSTMLWNYIAQ